MMLKHSLCKRTLSSALFSLLVLAGCEKKAETPAENQSSQSSLPIPVKVVVVNMFEIGEDEGDTAGEFQLW